MIDKFDFNVPKLIGRDQSKKFKLDEKRGDLIGLNGANSVVRKNNVNYP